MEYECGCCCIGSNIEINEKITQIKYNNNKCNKYLRLTNTKKKIYLHKLINLKSIKEIIHKLRVTEMQNKLARLHCAFSEKIYFTSSLDSNSIETNI